MMRGMKAETGAMNFLNKLLPLGEGHLLARWEGAVLLVF